MTNSTDWMNDALLYGIHKDKLDFLQKLVFEAKDLSPSEKLPFFMALAARSKQSSISFSEQEIDCIITVLKKNSTAAEIAKMDQILKTFKEKSKK